METVLAFLTGNQAFGLAVLTASITAVGFFVKSVLGERATRRSREEDIRELCLAIESEITVNGEAAVTYYTIDSLTRILDRMTAYEKQGKEFDPFTFPGPDNFIFEIAKTDIFILPENAIKQVVRYYKMDQALNGAMKSMHTKDFRDLDNARQRKSLIAIFAIGFGTTQAACDALEKLAITTGSALPPFVEVVKSDDWQQWSTHIETLSGSLPSQDNGQTLKNQEGADPHAAA